MDEPISNLRLGLLLSRLKRFKDALTPLRMAWSNEQKNGKIANALARALDETGDFDTAQVMYETALRLDPGLIEARYNLATLRFNDLKFESAIAHYVDYMVVAGETSIVRRNIGMALLELGEPESAIASFNKAIVLDSTDASIYYNLGLAYDITGDYEKARQSFEAAIEISPTHYEARYSLAKLLRDNGMIQEAMAEFSTLLQTNPDHHRALNGLALCHMALKDVDNAIALLRQSIEACPTYAAGHYNLAAALRGLGEGEEARVHFLAANDLDPTYGTTQPIHKPRLSNRSGRFVVAGAPTSNPKQERTLQLPETK